MIEQKTEMTIKEAKKIVSKVKKTPHEERIKILSQQDWDFINTLNRHFEKYPGWEDISTYWAKRLTEINEQIRVIL